MTITKAPVASSRPPDSTPAPDLLCPTPSLRLDAASLKQTLVFAFASGVPASVFDQALEAMALPPSNWQPACFANELFLNELVRTCMRVTIDGAACRLNEALLARVLSHPPSDPETVVFRRTVLEELASSDSLRRSLEALYAAAQRLRNQLEAVPGLRRIESNRRRIDILASLKKCLDLAAEGFAGATSALGRIDAFGSAVRKRDAYQRLTDLLEYDEHIATLDLRMRLGSDGRIRATIFLGARENKTNAFYASAVGRFIAKIALLLRGYRFSDEEVLARLIDGVFDGLENEVVALFQLMADMEFYLAGLAFRDTARAHGLEVCFAEMVGGRDADPDGGLERRWCGLFNPLLLGHVPKVVPCDLHTARPDLTLIVTGPNSGGKTRLLQAVAIAQMLAQSGLFVPASSARLFWTQGLFVSLIEQATADQSEGRLGMELLRIRSLFEKIRMGAMVIVDELCSGTNPSEGEEIFELVVSLLAELRPQAFITTHFLSLAARIERHPPAERLAFLQVELGDRQLPTFQFVPGVATTSLAHRTAARLGVTREELWRLVEQSKRLDGT